SLQDVADVLDFVARHDLVPNVDPVQYSIRLLVPRGSLLLDDPELALDAYDPELLSYTWRSPDARVDALQARLASIAEDAATTGEAASTTYRSMRAATADAMGDRAFDTEQVLAAVGAGSAGRPRLTEPWFCCAEPTALQFGPLGQSCD
ncbi:MAG TPA: CUAEP/CCAEP-tail radical SAM protein, partial [Acidimicrobiales bacterium]|nr:CUAEP/CCAEP-tail radical SAM protein [Acidimicrobiales bacterium]